MDREIEGLYKALTYAHAKIGALEAIIHVLAGMEAQRNPMMVALLKRTAAGDGPDDLVPDGPVAPPNATREERAVIEANHAVLRKATKQATMELANQLSGFIERANRRPG
jgi:hypothetical protein